MIRMRAPWIDRYQDEWNKAMLPYDGQVVSYSQLVTKYYKAKHEEDGTITYKPITSEEAKNDSEE